MRTKILLFPLILLVYFIGSNSVNAQTINDLCGEWNAEAPQAPSGFNTSIMAITQDSVFTTFTGESYPYGSISMSFNNDTLSFEIGGLNVLCTLKVEDKTRLSGNAVWEGGESKLILTRKEDEPSSDE
jgi:hypothetical protein